MLLAKISRATFFSRCTFLTVGRVFLCVRTVPRSGRRAFVLSRGFRSARNPLLFSRRTSGSEDVPVEPQRIVEFWFKELTSDQHFAKDPELDDRIRKEFGKTHELALSGKLDNWAKEMPSCLALVVVLDQFSRNLYRGTPKAFSGDAKALEISKKAIKAGFHNACDPFNRQATFYLPFMHSEALEDQRRCVELYDLARKASADDNKMWAEFGLDFARKHLAVVEQFGRFPHRNEALGRTCTPEELEFLKQPGSSF